MVAVSIKGFFGAKEGLTSDSWAKNRKRKLRAGNNAIKSDALDAAERVFLWLMAKWRKARG
jgi:hypothetical protein